MKKILDTALRYGVILGVVMVCIDLINYGLMPKQYRSEYFWMGSSLVWLGSTIYWAWLQARQRKVFPLKECFVFCLAVMSGSAIIESSYRLVLFQLIDPEIFAQFKAYAIDNLARLDSTLSAAKKEELSQAIDKSYQPLNLMTSLFLNILVYTFPALGISLLFRKKEVLPQLPQ